MLPRGPFQPVAHRLPCTQGLRRFGSFSQLTCVQGWDRGFLSQLRVSHMQDSISLTIQLSITAVRRAVLGMGQSTGLMVGGISASPPKVLSPGKGRWPHPHQAFCRSSPAVLLQRPAARRDAARAAGASQGLGPYIQMEIPSCQLRHLIAVDKKVPAA